MLPGVEGESEDIETEEKRRGRALVGVGGGMEEVSCEGSAMVS